MKALATFVSLFALLATNASAQVNCGIPGVTVDLSPANPMSGELIDVTITNNSMQMINIPNTCLYTGVFPSADCSGTNLSPQFCLLVIIPVPPGGTYTTNWNQLSSGMQVPDGTYSFNVRYTDASFGTTFSCCVPFMIGTVAPIQSLCNGDGGNQAGCTNCPCGNNAPVGTIGGCLNSAGTSAELEASGDLSVSLPAGSTTDLRFGLSGAPPNAFCILNSGDAVAPGNPTNPCFGLDSGAQAVAFDGLRCAITNTRRHGGRSADALGEVGVTNSPWGGEGGPPAGLAVAFGGFASGQTRYFQVINRDDATMVCMRGLNTSQAAEITFTP